MLKKFQLLTVYTFLLPHQDHQNIYKTFVYSSYNLNFKTLLIKLVGCFGLNGPGVVGWCDGPG